jgi:hypothetical protein
VVFLGDRCPGMAVYVAMCLWSHSPSTPGSGPLCSILKHAALTKPRISRALVGKQTWYVCMCTSHNPKCHIAHHRLSGSHSRHCCQEQLLLTSQLVVVGRTAKSQDTLTNTFTHSTLPAGTRYTAGKLLCRIPGGAHNIVKLLSYHATTL